MKQQTAPHTIPGVSRSAAHPRRRVWTIWFIRLAFTLAALVWLLFRMRSVDLGPVAAKLNLAVLLLSVLIQLTLRALAAGQLSLGLRALQIRFGLAELFAINMISGFYSLVLPGDLAGGVVGWHRLAQRDRKGVEVGALLIYLRLLNTLCLLLFALAGIWLAPVAVAPVLRGVAALMAAALALVALPFFSARAAGFIEQTGARVLAGLPVPARLQHIVQAAWQSIRAFHSLANPRSLAVLVSISLGSQLLGVLNFSMLAAMLGLGVPFFALIWIRTAITIVQMMPLSLAGLGVREISLVALLQLYGVTTAQALTFSLVLLGLRLILGTIGGLFELRDVLRRRRQLQQAGSAGGGNESYTPAVPPEAYQDGVVAP